MTRFPKIQLGEVASDAKGSIAIGPFGSRMKADTYVASGLPVIRGTNISDGWSLTGDWVFVPNEFAKEMPNCVLHGGELVFPHRGAIGQVAYIEPTKAPLFLSSSMMKFRPHPNKADGRFLTYFFKSPEGKEEILRFSSSVGTPGIGQPLASLRQFQVPLPPVDQQKAIAAVLSALDDKIELNRRMNETLEGMAQAIFKDWFVDFGPTRRKLTGITDPVAIMGGLTPDAACAATLAALFADTLGDDGLPVGWRFGRAEEVFELAYGKSLPKTERADGPFPVYGSGGVTGTHTSALVEGPGIIVGRKGTVGSLYWEQDGFFPIDTVFYVKPQPGFSFEQIWFLLGSLGLEHMNTDAAVPGLNRNNVYRLDVPIAPHLINDEFCKFALPLRAKTQSNLAENRTLAETRDYLLPKLMSGEVRVRDAERLAVGAPA